MQPDEAEVSVTAAQPTETLGTLHQQALYELALSFGGETDARQMLRRTLPLLIRRTASTAGAVLHRCEDGWETVHITPAVLGRQPAWEELRERVEQLDDEVVAAGTALLTIADRSHHVLPLPAYGRRILSRGAAIPPDFTAELVRLLAVFARPLVADHEARRREQTELVLHDLGQRQQGLLDALPHPSWLCGPNGEYLEVNETFLAWVGRPREEVIGAGPLEVHPSRGSADLAATRTVLETGVARTDTVMDPNTGQSFREQRTP